MVEESLDRVVERCVAGAGGVVGGAGVPIVAGVEASDGKALKSKMPTPPKLPALHTR